jgi:hypothetical protein
MQKHIIVNDRYKVEYTAIPGHRIFQAMQCDLHIEYQDRKDTVYPSDWIIAGSEKNYVIGFFPAYQDKVDRWIYHFFYFEHLSYTQEEPERCKELLKDHPVWHKLFLFFIAGYDSNCVLCENPLLIRATLGIRSPIPIEKMELVCL